MYRWPFIIKEGYNEPASKLRGLSGQLKEKWGLLWAIGWESKDLGGAKQMTGCSLEEKCGENFWKLRQNEMMLTWTTEGAVHVMYCSTSQRDDHKIPKEEWIDWQETVHQCFKPGSVSVSSGMAQPYLGGLPATLKWMGSEPSPHTPTLPLFNQISMCLILYSSKLAFYISWH